ncbi:MAG: class II glutamine amidotransferase [Myxococcales bacterium]|nr:MAG: class II glutamine amidotransferase [Myxococcales bacterium]
MGRILGFMGKGAQTWAQVLSAECDTITRIEMNSQKAAWGIAFYQGDEILHKKRPEASTEDLDWRDLAADVKSECLLAQVRVPYSENFRIENTQPFRFRRWSFAHVGNVRRLDAVHDQLQETLPDFIKRNLRGDTDSELFFHLLLASMHGHNLLDRFDVDAFDVLTSIRQTLEGMTEVLNQDTQSLSFVLTNGRQMFALSHGDMLAYRALVQPDNDRKPSGHVLISGPLTQIPPGYTKLLENTVLSVKRDLSTEIHPL